MKFNNFLGTFTSIILLLMIFNVFLDVILRYFFNWGSIALQEAEWHLFSIMFLFGIAYALNDDAHVRVDFIYDNVKTKTKAYINIFGTIFFLIPFSLLLIYGSYEFVTDSYFYSEISEDPGGLYYRWLIKAMIPLSFAVLIISSLRYIKKNITMLKGEK
jgi:TRAP-type mannitol/chloroaromatic compound transport system permease small subunit